MLRRFLHPSLSLSPSLPPSLQVRGGRYSRFSLQPERDGVQHVEVRLSEDTLDDTTEVNGQPAAGYPSYQPSPATKRRHQYFYMALGTLLTFLIGELPPSSSSSLPSSNIYIQDKSFDYRKDSMHGRYRDQKDRVSTGASQ